ncbi:hypothetical protein DRO33_00830 [Candidatus Bathyarchaeota archaeon]|nr:MAG: hypothetical protein DRO33_00830 [Candidatus Bathyarchaeota archaeon]
MEGLRIIAADSGGAILDERFEPRCVLCTVAVLVEAPYKAPSAVLAEPMFWPIEDSYSVLLKELELARKLLEEHGADVIHFDLSFRGARLNELNAVELSKYTARVPDEVKPKLTKVLHRLKFAASEIWARMGVSVVCLGKESVPVRIAELCCAAHSLLFSARKVVEEGRELLVGLPVKCVVEVSGDLITARSLIPAEHDLLGIARDEEGLLRRVRITEMLNPVARGFRALLLRPTGQP